MADINFKYHNPIFGFEVSSSLFQKQLDVCLFVYLLVCLDVESFEMAKAIELRF